MKRILIILLMAGVVYGARPGVPTDVPFEHDPNKCLSEVMDWVICEPYMSTVYACGYHNRWGLDVSIEMISGDPNVAIITDRLDKANDPNGGWNQYYQFGITPPAGEKVHYIEIVSTDKAGRQDKRTLLLYAVYDDEGYLFPVTPLPLTRTKEAQRLWQMAKKAGKPLTKPTKIWN